MNPVALSINLIQITLSSLLLFFVLALLIEGCFKLFKVVNSRVRALCRCLPLVKLLLSFLLFGQLKKTTFLDLNFFSCNSYFKLLLLNFFSAEERNFASHLPEIALYFFLALGGGITLFIICVKALQFLSAVRQVNKIVRTSLPCTTKIINPSLNHRLETGEIKLLISTAVQSPIAFGQKTILLPKNLMTHISQQEFEAIVAHELEHLLWKDPLLKAFTHFIQAIFWWIPMRWWLNRIEADQELACDGSIQRHYCNGEDLASAMLKTVKLSRQNPQGYAPAFSQLTSHTSHNMIRIQKLLEAQPLASCWTALSPLGVATIMTLCLLLGIHIC